MMDRRHKLAAVPGVAALLLLAGACNPNLTEEDTFVGQEISFSASTGYLNNRIDTRTSYSGEDENGHSVSTSSQYERIDWLAKDEFMVYSPDATNIEGADNVDYIVVSVDESGQKSMAIVEPIGNKGLLWNSGTHSFYAVYPNPAKNASVSLTAESSSVSISGTVPAAQTILSWSTKEHKIDENTTETELVAKPDMNYAYMFAASTGITPESKASLYFKPMTTAFQVTVKSATDDELTLKKIRLVSSSCALTGNFTTQIPIKGSGDDPNEVPTGVTTMSNYATDAASFTCPAFDDSGETPNNIIEINLGNQVIYKTAAEGHPTSATVTFLTLPQNLTDLSIELYTNATADNEPRILDLKQNATTFASFDACNKVFVNNIGIPGGAFTYHMDSIDDIIIDDEAVMIDVTREVTVHTYKSIEGMEDIPVGWKMFFTTEDPASLVGGNIQSETVGGFQKYFVTINDEKHYLKDAPCTTNEATTETVTDAAYLSTATDANGKITGDGVSNVRSFVIGKSPLPPANPSDISVNTEAITLRYESPFLGQIARLQGRSYTDLDLSTYDFIAQESGKASETANCYIIDGWGSFRIPLVYGNAIKNGAENSNAYTYNGNESNCLHNFINADGAVIGNPWILEDMGISSSQCSGRVVWQDSRFGYEIVRDTVMVSGVVQYPISITSDGRYMTFSIRQEDIHPGNVLLALYDNTNDRVLWSWHLWVYGEELSTKTVERTIDGTSHSTTFLSANLGWAAPMKYRNSTTQARDQYAVIAVNDGTDHNGTILGSFRVFQKQFTVFGEENNLYSGTFYQWGCKNPYLPIGYVLDVNDPSYISASHEEQLNRIDESKNCKYNTSTYYHENNVDPLNRAVCVFSKHRSGNPRFNKQSYISISQNQAGTQYQDGTINGINNWASYCIKYSHQNPHKCIVEYDSQYHTSSVRLPILYKNYRNIWNSTYNGDEYHTEKSIYDPCPRGFCVPRIRNFLVLFDPARDTDDTSSNGNYRARGFGNPNNTGNHEIFGDYYNGKGGSSAYGGILFYTQSGEPDLDFPKTGYRGEYCADCQPFTGGYLQTADLYDPLVWSGSWDTNQNTVFYYGGQVYYDFNWIAQGHQIRPVTYDCE